MRNKLLTFIVIIELLSLIVFKVNNKKEYKHSVNIYKVSNLDKAKLENYVIGVVAAEMPATFSIEALKAQAVAARTFSYKKLINNKIDINNLTSDKGQAYYTKEDMKSSWKESFNEYYDKISKAVLSTKGEVITYNGDIINSYYFSLSNGKTENSSNVFGEAKYLVSVDSPWDVNNKSYSIDTSISKDAFKKTINIKDNIYINDIKRTSTNHVEYIIINNRKYTGVEFRKLFNLRSTDFNIDINDNEVIINTKGYGHGVGMSQYGANSMAKEGKTYDEIIKYYYQGVMINKI